MLTRVSVCSKTRGSKYIMTDLRRDHSKYYSGWRVTDTTGARRTPVVSSSTTDEPSMTPQSLQDLNSLRGLTLLLVFCSHLHNPSSFLFLHMSIQDLRLHSTFNLCFSFIINERVVYKGVRN